MRRIVNLVGRLQVGGWLLSLVGRWQVGGWLRRSYSGGASFTANRQLRTSQLFLIILLGFGFALSPTPTSTPEACYIQNQTFQGGEELTYKLYYNWNFVWMAAGEVTFRVEDTGTQYHLSAVGKTYHSYDRFFKVRDNYDTYLDKNSLLPVVSIRDVKEGNYVLYDKVVLNQGEHKAVSYRGDNADQTTKRDFELSGCMHDILSVLYYARNVDYEQSNAGMSFPIKLFMDKQEHPLSFKYKGKVANVALRDMGKYNTLKLSPKIINGRVFKAGSEVNVYVSDDANKIPLLIESPLSVGSVKAVLKSYKGLRYDFKAKVE